MKIRITKCNAYGPGFVNMTPGSEHEVLRIKQGKSGIEGFYVNSGVEDGEVLILVGEGNIVEEGGEE